MRITKRSSGGRGKYEISEPFGPTTPRDLLNHTLVLDLGEGLRIPTGVVLLDREDALGDAQIDGAAGQAGAGLDGRKSQDRMRHVHPSRSENGRNEITVTERFGR